MQPPSSAGTQFSATLQMDGLHAALGFLNHRTPYRFTGVYRFEDEMLRNVSLFDRRSPRRDEGTDAPMRETFCALVQSAGGALAVTNGRSDARFPWMSANAVVSYCGAVMVNEAGDPFGTVCHFDMQECETMQTEMDVLRVAASQVMRHLSSGGS